MTITWILIANSSKACLFESSYAKLFNGSAELKLVEEFTHPESRLKNQELLSDRPGTKERGYNRTATLNERSEPKELEAGEFARELVTKLEEGRLQHIYDKLIMVAPPRFQGLLNKCMEHHPQVLQKITKTIEKDYTKIKSNDLVAQLQSHL